jgi:hypothetical protein
MKTIRTINNNRQRETREEILDTWLSGTVKSSTGMIACTLTDGLWRTVTMSDWAGLTDRKE